jgi:SAM-dependent methyltransferase
MLNSLRCPNCLEKLQINFDQKKLICTICGNSYKKTSNFFEIISEKDIGHIERKSLEIWGKDLHKDSNKNKVGHIDKINEKFDEFPRILSGDVLEVGCGTGADSEYISNLSRVDNIVALDIGENCKDIARENLKNKKLKFVRANCLNIPFQNEQFKFVYSYGVIHHTSNPLKALIEINRILKPKGKVYLYLYSSHTNNFPKRIGIFFETYLMKFLSLLNKKLQLSLIFLISIFCWFSFSIPSLILKLLGKRKLAEKFPLHWGLTPLKIIPDLKDRLLAPINHRFSTKKIRKLLLEANFVELDIIEDYSGLYLSAQKN